MVSALPGNQLQLSFLKSLLGSVLFHTSINDLGDEMVWTCVSFAYGHQAGGAVVKYLRAGLHDLDR